MFLDVRDTQRTIAARYLPTGEMLGWTRAPQCTSRSVSALSERIATARHQRCFGMTDNGSNRCSWVGCSAPENATIDSRPFCLGHFLEIADRRLQSIDKTFKGEAGAREVPADIQSVLSQMISQMSLLAASTKRLDAKVRERLISLSTQAANLYEVALRPPRFNRSVPCQIRISISSSETPEKCTTLNVSQRGASVEISQSYPLKQAVTLEREDTGKRARAEVVWIKRKSAQAFIAGLAILDQDDFWGLGPLHGSMIRKPAKSHTKSVSPLKKTK